MQSYITRRCGTHSGSPPIIIVWCKTADEERPRAITVCLWATGAFLLTAVISTCVQGIQTPQSLKQVTGYYYQKILHYSSSWCVDHFTFLDAFSQTFAWVLANSNAHLHTVAGNHSGKAVHLDVLILFYILFYMLSIIITINVIT